FFSSRRRHTRFSRDWSSDVCSSDLDKQCRRSDGSWDDSCKLLDYMVWYSGDCKQNTPPKTTPESCRDYRPLNTQFRKTGDSTWKIGRASCREGGEIRWEAATRQDNS